MRTRALVPPSSDATEAVVLASIAVEETNVVGGNAVITPRGRVARAAVGHRRARVAHHRRLRPEVGEFGASRIQRCHVLLRTH